MTYVRPFLIVLTFFATFFFFQTPILGEYGGFLVGMEPYPPPQISVNATAALVFATFVAGLVAGTTSALLIRTQRFPILCLSISVVANLLMLRLEIGGRSQAIVEILPNVAWIRVAMTLPCEFCYVAILTAMILQDGPKAKTLVFAVIGIFVVGIAFAICFP